MELPNPVVTAAGCAGAGRELAQFFDIASLGAVTTKSVMLEPHAGRPAPRMAETPSGMLSTTGMQGPGLDVLLQRDLPWLLSRGGRAIVSVAGTGVAEFGEIARRLSRVEGISAIEVNLSCPDPESASGLTFADTPGRSEEVVGVVRSLAGPDLPVLAKLAGDVPDVVETAGVCVEAGADGLSMINTLRGMAVDTRSLRPSVSGGMGGLSGPAVRPIAVGCVYRVHEALPEVPIIGMGGVRTGQDVLEFMAAGASAVAVGTANFSDPSAGARVLREFTEALENRGRTSAAGLVGAAHRTGPRG